MKQTMASMNQIRSVDQEIYSIKLNKVGLIHTITNAIFYKTTNTESLGYVRNIEKMNKLTYNLK